MIDPGRLDQRVYIDAPQHRRNSDNERVTDWTHVATTWARIEARASSEDTDATGTDTETRYRLTLRYREDIGPAMRIHHRGQVLEIESVRDADSSRRFLTIEAIAHA